MYSSVMYPHIINTARVYINCPAACMCICIIAGFYILPFNTEVYIMAL